MNYAESLEYVYNAKQAGAVKNGLLNITELLKRLDNPQTLFPCVHVAGTNGKGSVCAFVESMLREAGYRTGLFTSPYLERFTERIRIGAEEIGEEDFAALATHVRAAADAMVREGLGHPTFFELITACCFLYFADRQVDIAVIETGLGGRTDATNVVHPLVSVITSIGIDHAQSLGNTIEKIAGEKAGIIKPGAPCVLSAGNDVAAVEVIRQAAKDAGSRLVLADGCVAEPVTDSLDGQVFNLKCGELLYEGLDIKLLGRHQVSNAVTAVLAVLELVKQGFAINEAAIRAGMMQARWPGRMEVLQKEPLVMIDGAHNPQGAGILAAAVCRYMKEKPVCLVMGAMADKDAGPMIEQFSSFATKVIATLPPSHARQQHSAEGLAHMFNRYGLEAVAIEDWRQALSTAMGSGMAVVVAGSLYLAGAARTWFLVTRPNLIG